MEIFVSLFAACVIVFPIFLIHTAIVSSPKRQEKAVEKATKMGHVVRASLVKKSTPFEDTVGADRRFVSAGVYRYTYKGKEYKYRCRERSLSPTLTLYFIKNPRKAVRKNELVESNVCWPVVFGIVALISYWITTSPVG